MFSTRPEAEMAVLNALFSADGTRIWSYIELNRAIPWFCVVVRQEDEDGVIAARTFLLAEPRQLAMLCETAGARIEGVEVILPSYMTGKPGWTMKSLRAIWSGRAPDGTGREVFITSTGRRYAHQEEPLHERDLADPRLLFRWRAPRTEADQSGQE